MKSVLITGGTGFTGSHLLDLYVKEYPEVELHTIRRRRSDVANVVHLINHSNNIRWHDCDITDAHAVEDMIRTTQPDILHHLAAQSFVPASWTNPISTFEVNVNASINILEAVRKFSPHTVLQVASSSEIYGIPEIVPIIETNLPKPVSPYAISKLTLDHLAFQYHKSYHTKTIITRAFNHTGPRRGELFVTSSFAKQIATLEKKGGGEIKVGNLDARRDFTDVRDMVRAYVLACDHCTFGVPYNICSNRIVPIHWVLHQLLSHAKGDFKVTVDPARLRPSDLHTLQGDCTPFIKDTGWTRQYELETTLFDLLNYWRERV